MKGDKTKTILLPATLCLVAVIMSFLIVGVYMLTKDSIETQAIAAREAARRSVLSQAVTMTELPLEEGSPVDYCFEGFDAQGQSVGLVSQITVTGFGGPIEVTVGVDTAGVITAVSVGGSDFSETSGLGSKTRDADFTNQFIGKSGMLVLKQNIDSVTGASVSSGAVVSGVNQALVYMTGRLPAAQSAEVEEIPLTQEQIDSLLPGAQNLRFMGGGSGIDGWWQADNGRIVQATGFGLGPIVVRVGMDNNGYCVGIIIGDESFMESAGYGAKVQEPSFWQAFLGKQGAQTFGEGGVDAVSGASTSSKAALAAINACLTFDPAAVQEVPAAAETVAGSADPAQSSSGEASGEMAPAPEADAVTEATTVQETLPEPTAAPVVTAEPAAASPEIPAREATAEPADAVDAADTVNAVTQASTVEEAPAATPVPTPSPVPTADAVSEASVVEEVLPEPTAVPTPDAVSEASSLETAVPTPTPTPDAQSGATLGG